MKPFFLRHVVAICMAFVVGALSVAPHLLAVRALGDAYRGIPFLYLDDEDLYLTRMQEIADGHESVGSPVFYEYKNTVAVLPPTGEWVYVIASRMTGLTLAQMLVVSKAVLPAVLFLLVYALLWRLLPADSSRLRTAGAVVGGLLVSLGYDLMSVRNVLAAMRGQNIGVFLSIWTRPVNPILGGIGLFGYLILLWDAMEQPRAWRTIASGVMLGVLVFYFFSWGVAISATVIWLVVLACQKQWLRVRDLGIIILISFLASAPYWFATLTSIGGAEGRAFAMRNGMFFTHAPLMNKTLLAALVVYFLATAVLARQIGGWKRLVQERWWLFGFSLLLGGLAAMNQQIITGREIWPYHFVQYTKPFVMVALVAACLRAVPARWSKAALAGCAAVSAFVFLQGIAAASTYPSVLADFRERQNDAAVFSWLNANAPTDCVVAAKEEKEHFDRLIPAYTHCNVYRSSFVFSGVPLDRVRHNFFLQLRLQGVTADGAREYLLTHSDLVRGAFFDDWKTIFGTAIDDWLLRQLDKLVPAYAEFLQQPAGDALRKYRADYLISKDPLTTQEQREWRIQNEPVEVGGERIYRL
jgi:hypothetical protein